MNTTCTRICCSEEERAIIKRILAKNNRDGPMGSGGYHIQLAGFAERASVIKFTPLDVTPNGAHYVFVQGGMIWATYMKGFILELLADAGIEFRCGPVQNPLFITNYMAEIDPR